ncbi:retron Ec48 family effector membrane protein [Oceanobacter sp. 3_MG-2023]|uniref:retron Ec48 family effector membrane protein n=1 Tax=Oceanobacter sp. 3_MG-2023 TaxID=3062622 RepID=UPI002734137A|nr:retron Ec48 family effector membrane protein [Oceanobacter sp. 3_MG-2023]MDP2506357.1 retron Ec48 family effector membrane protein [Oceanobacter sp. 3_MG-2023]
MNKRIVMKIILFIFLPTTVVSVFSVYETSITTYTEIPDLCMSNKCLIEIYETYSVPLDLFVLALNLIIPLTTLFTLLITIDSVKENKSTATIQRHLSTYNTFVNFLDVELAQLKTINPSSINKVIWFNRMYMDPNNNNYRVSPEYIRFMEEINKNITESNTRYMPGKHSDFKYKSHQYNMIAVFNNIGMDISNGPRLEFFELEGELLKLIEKTNIFFLSKEKEFNIKDRVYS